MSSQATVNRFPCLASASSTTAISWRALICRAVLPGWVPKSSRSNARKPAIPAAPPDFRQWPERLFPPAEHGQTGTLRKSQGSARSRSAL